MRLRRGADSQPPGRRVRRGSGWVGTGARRGVGGEAHYWYPGHLALPGEDGCEGDLCDSATVCIS